MRAIILLLAAVAGLGCEYCGGSAAVRSSPSGGPWSAASTWSGGVLPAAGDPVVIDVGSTVTLDTSTPPLRSLKIAGTLRASTAVDSAITADWVMVAGAGARLEAGSDAAPLSRRCTITLTGTNRTANVTGTAPLTTGTKFLMAMEGGTIALHGASRAKRAWTVLAGHAAAGATSITLADAGHGWQAGDQVCIAPTGFVAEEAEEVTVTAVAGTTLTISPALAHPHWGTVQTYDGTAVDERAEVGLLTHTIIVRGAADAVASGFGGHTMIMPGARGDFSGVRFERMGQRGLPGRYALHWHLIDRLPAGGVAGAGQQVRNCAFVRSFQRAVNVHGTNGIRIADNVAFDIENHAYVLSEDGDEAGIDASGNLAVLVRPPTGNEFAFRNDSAPFESAQNESVAAGFWMRNANQRIVGNRVAGVARGNGYAFDADEGDLPFSSPLSITARNLRGRCEFSGNSARTVLSIHGFRTHQYQLHSGFGVLMTQGYHGRGLIHMSGGTFAKCGAAALWSDHEAELFADNVVADCTALAHIGSAQLVRNLVVGFTANARGRESLGEEPDDGRLRDASGVSLGGHQPWMPGSVRDNRFINLNDAAFEVSDGYATAPASLSSGNTFTNVTPARFNRQDINLNTLIGPWFDRDGALGGLGVESLISGEPLSSASLPRPGMDAYVTPLAALGWQYAWIDGVRDGDAIVRGQPLRLQLRGIPAGEPDLQTFRLDIEGHPHPAGSVIAAPGQTQIDVVIAADAPLGWAHLALRTQSIHAGQFDRLFVRIVDGGGPVTPPPAGWTAQDIGAPGRTGASTHDIATGRWTVSGGGSDIWGTSDRFRFVHQPLTGDGTVTAHVISQTNTHAWAKAGVMIRDGTTPTARHAMTAVTPTRGVAFQRRVTTGGVSAHTAGSPATAPRWLRVQRAGNVFTGRESVDGATWTTIGNATIAMPAATRAGLCVTAHDNATLSTAVFEQVTIAPSGGG